VFVDESGDLGSGRGSSRYITLGAVATHQQEALERIPKKIRRRRLKKSLLMRPELKFHSSNPTIRRGVLGMVVRSADVRIASITLDKSGLSDESFLRRDRLYRDLSGELITDLLRNERPRGDLTVIFDDRPFERSIGRDFDDYIEGRIADWCSESRVFPPRTMVSRLNSIGAKGLQVADFVAGAIHRRYESGDPTYYDIISPRIVSEKCLFFP
jgi:hypothetical protein